MSPARPLRDAVSLAMRALLRALVARRPAALLDGETVALALTAALLRVAFLALAEDLGLARGPLKDLGVRRFLSDLHQDRARGARLGARFDAWPRLCALGSLTHDRLGGRCFDPTLCPTLAPDAGLSDAEVLASLGPFARVLEGATPHALGSIYEAARRWSAAPSPRKGWRLVRRASEAHYTPPDLARWLAERALCGREQDRPSVCDPAMGAGALLLAACEVLGGADPQARLHIARAQLFGADLDPWAVEAAKLSLWLHARAVGWRLDFMDHALKVVDALTCRWEEELPQVFGRAEPGFDVCLLNPPFSGKTERGAAKDGLAPFTGGAHDRSLRFMGRVAQGLLRPGGAYGWIAPQAILGQERPWRAWLEARWPTREVLEVPWGAFGQAQVRALAQVGGLRRDEGNELGGQRPPNPRLWGGAPTLGEHVEVRAGCITEVAYALLGWISDEEGGHGPKLVTTGALERYHCRWGTRPTRYLGHQFTHPRWPTEAAPDAVRRAQAAQHGPKVLLGGLTRALEAWCDAQGEAAGVVSVWILRPKARPDALACKALAVLLNSATFSRLFWTRNGAPTTARGHATVQKAALLATPLPDLWADEPTLSRLAALYDALSAQDPPPEAEREAHLAVADLYGLPAPEAQADLDAWRARLEGPPRRRPLRQGS